MIELKNQLKLTPQLILTPQLKLILKILQFNNLELTEYLWQEAQENPFIEIEHKDLSLGETKREERKEIALTEEINWEDCFSLEKISLTWNYEPPEEEVNLLERTLKSEENLSQHLLWQIGLLEFSPYQLEIAQYIIGNLDDKGYLMISPEEIAKDLKVSLEEVEKVRKLILKLDPVGVGALNLKECLLAQLEFLGYSENTLPYKLVALHLEELVYGIEKLSEKLKEPSESLNQALEIIKGLEPYPARNYLSVRGIYIEPDLRFYKEEEEWRVEILKEKIPKVFLSSLYYKFWQQKREFTKNKDFFKEKLKIAENLIKALDSRYSSLYKVGSAILEVQKEFLERGINFLKPLTLKDLSQITGLHESTVSRIINSKYVETPIGLYPLKFFLSSGYNSSKGEEVSSLAIKDSIKRLIEREDYKKPLSDSEIAKLLQQSYGIKIARRTVTKYREELGIPSIRERKNKK